MSRYTGATDADRREMLDAIGAGSLDDLFAEIPDAVRLDRELERAIEPKRLRDVGEQILDRAGADRREHLAPVVVGGGGVAGHSEASDASRER